MQVESSYGQDCRPKSSASGTQWASGEASFPDAHFGLACGRGGRELCLRFASQLFKSGEET